MINKMYDATMKIFSLVGSPAARPDILVSSTFPVLG